MNSITPTPITTTTTLANFSPSLSSTQSSSNLQRPKFKFNKQNDRNPVSKSIQCVHNRNFSPHPSSSSSESSIRNPCALASCLAAAPAPAKASEQVVADKAKRLVLEFKSLSEPIDRVKRLLQYAANLPPCKESAREPESRVPGCATQVWVEAELDELGRMRFRADSDSEISKGFCSCLIWMLDGGEPREVLAIRAQDLDDVNVGVYGKANSRVNTWHNVLLAMQRKTRALVTALDKTSEDALPSLLVASTDEVSS